MSILWLRRGGRLEEAESGQTILEDGRMEEEEEEEDLSAESGEDGAGLYLLSMSSEDWIYHVWHGAAALMPLFDIKLLNRTAADGSGSIGQASRADTEGAAGPSSPVQHGGMGAAPPIDLLVMAGSYRPIRGVEDMQPWLGGLLRLLVQSHTATLFNTKAEQLRLSSSRMVCARRGAVLGYKPRLLTCA